MPWTKPSNGVTMTVTITITDDLVIASVFHVCCLYSLVDSSTSLNDYITWIHLTVYMGSVPFSPTIYPLYPLTYQVGIYPNLYPLNPNLPFGINGTGVMYTANCAVRAKRKQNALAACRDRTSDLGIFSATLSRLS